MDDAVKEAREAFRNELHRQADRAGHYVRSDTSLSFLQVEGVFDFNAAISAYEAKLDETTVRVPRESTEAMVIAGIAERHGQPVPEAWSLATANIYRDLLAAATAPPPSTTPATRED